MYFQGGLSEQLLSPKSCYFGVLLALIFFWGTVVLETATVKMIYFKHHIFVKITYFFQNTTCSRPFFKVVGRFI